MWRDWNSRARLVGCNVVPLLWKPRRAFLKKLHMNPVKLLCPSKSTPGYTNVYVVRNGQKKEVNPSVGHR